MKKSFTTTRLKNKEMNDGVYNLRREVMKYVYEAKALAKDLPRIDIRITDTDRGNLLGLAQMNDKIIWIPENSVTDEKYDLRTIVFHEILHAVYGIDHIDDCPLMKPIHTPLTKRQCEKFFVKYAS